MNAREELLLTLLRHAREVDYPPWAAANKERLVELTVQEAYTGYKEEREREYLAFRDAHRHLSDRELETLIETTDEELWQRIENHDRDGGGCRLPTAGVPAPDLRRSRRSDAPRPESADSGPAAPHPPEGGARAVNANLLDDIAHASAAYCFNCVLPRLEGLSASEQFELLKACFEANLAAYRDGVRGWECTPSEN